MAADRKKEMGEEEEEGATKDKRRTAREPRLSLSGYHTSNSELTSKTREESAALGMHRR